MKLYRVNVTAQISGSVEVDAESPEDAKELAGQMEYMEWDEVIIDSTDTPDEPDYLTEVCDYCGEVEGDCICEYCEQCEKNEDDCVCEYDEEEDEDDTDDE